MMQNRLSKQIETIIEWKKKMARHGLTQARATCPACGEKDAARIHMSPRNGHMHARCRACGWGMME